MSTDDNAKAEGEEGIVSDLVSVFQSRFSRASLGEEFSHRLLSNQAWHHHTRIYDFYKDNLNYH